MKEYLLFLHSIFSIGYEFIIYKYWSNTNTNKNNCIINIINKLSKINMFYIKLFQWFSDDRKFPKEISEYLKQFSDNVSYNMNDIDIKSLLNVIELSKINKDELIIDSFIPIKSGTISLIFKGILNNKPIIIKLLRKNIKEELELSVKLFMFIAKLINYISTIYNIDIDITTIIEYNKDILLEQINFINEVNNIEFFYKKYKNNNSVIIPFVYKKYTEEINNIIIMDYIDGKSLRELNNINEKEKYFLKYIKCVITGVYKYGIYHGDMHPGNILFIKNNEKNDDKYKIGLIDFGIVIFLDNKEKDFFFDFIFYFAKNDYEKYLKCIILLIKSDNPLMDQDFIYNKLIILKKNGKILKDGLFNRADLYILFQQLKEYKIKINNKIMRLLLAIVCSHLIFQNLTIKNYSSDELDDIIINNLIPQKLLLI